LANDNIDLLRETLFELLSIKIGGGSDDGQQAYTNVVG
jgi:hypothetical protein